MELRKSSMVKVSTDSVHCDVEDEIVILEMNEGNYYGLNPVGAFIWNKIQNPTQVGEIEKAILEEYDVDPDVCERDLMNLLGELLEKNLIELI